MVARVRSGHVVFSTNPVSNARVINNIFYQPKKAGVYFYANPLITNLAVSDNLSDRNIIHTCYDPNNSTAPCPPSGVTIGGNILNTNPLLVDPNGNNFHLTSGSPAIDTGLVLPEVTMDF